MQDTNNIRKLKIGRSSQFRESLNRWVSFPQIKLQGKWLKEAGFDPCTIIHVEVSKGRMVITGKEAKNG